MKKILKILGIVSVTVVLTSCPQTPKTFGNSFVYYLRGDVAAIAAEFATTNDITQTHISSVVASGDKLKFICEDGYYVSSSIVNLPPNDDIAIQPNLGLYEGLDFAGVHNIFYGNTSNTWQLSSQETVTYYNDRWQGNNNYYFTGGACAPKP
ncbi:hypothetical protein QIW49_00150 [Francisellaceae bacterium CB300]